MESVENSEVKKSRRSKKVKNLEEEVELIFSQDEGDEITNENMEEILLKTPSRRDKAKCPDTPTASQTVLQEMLQTPRRSCRKSIRPTQEYDDIINKSCTRSTKKHLLITEETIEEDVKNQDCEIIQSKWTPAKVGRVSQKRSRKSRRTDKSKKKEDKQTKELEEETIIVDEPEEVKVFEPILVEVTHENLDQVDPNELAEDEIEHKDKFEEIENITKQIKIKIDSNASENVEVVNKNHNQTNENKEFLENRTEHIEKVDEIEENNEQIKDSTEINISKSDNRDQQVLDNEIDDNDAFGNHDESIQLVQEDSEDCKEFEQKSEQEEICIVYESNISNNELNVESEDHVLSLNSQKTTKKELGDSFGCYLKSKQMNISDLGLNLLKFEGEEKDVLEVDNQIMPCDDVEEMPSLIVCDEDDQEDEGKKSNKLNETFEADDFAKTVEGVTQNSDKPSEEIMETLQMSDDDVETPRKRPRVALSDTSDRNQNILSTLKVSAVKVNPKEIVLRGIRKRSLSVCINGNEQKGQKMLAGPLAKAKQDRMVSFYSPANQQTIIDDLDMMIAKSLKKQRLQENQNTLCKFVTTRRKRSISLDESIMSTSQISKLPRPVLGQSVSIKSKPQTSTSSSKPLSRTKLPNFAAIHQKQFKKMENLVEHVSRKEERSKKLINSATKLKPVSAQKNVSIMKNSNNITNEKPKALKKIDLGATSQMNKSLLNTTSTAALNRTQDGLSVSKVLNLPDPRLAKITKPIKSGSISHRPPQQTPIRNYLKTSQTTNIAKPKVNAKAGPSKPTFNLSTSLLVKPTTSSTSFVDRSNTSHMSSEDKMASRLQRHMDLFKGRVPSTRAGVASRKNEVILKGVRSNRRFELQMQHRKNLEQ
ncbi:uncharacterized protein Mink isoform X2 [Calliphora vicina]|uniref:uncharacterized protein Mink isoform X2 n=1 Tax=Calliphora vicina TaxID=7373 RepID=UPI00325B42BF